MALTVLAAAAAFVLVSRRDSSTAAMAPQRRQTQSRRTTRTPSPAKAKLDYSLFMHEDHREGLKCSSCHAIPSAANPDRIAAATKPSIVRGYPYHDSCLRCHRQQIFRGDRPVFCTVCHTRVSTRMTARDVYSQFPSPRRGDIMAREFPGYFPHGLHQSLMASRRPRRPPDAETALSLLRVSFHAAAPAEARPKASDSCAACHLTDERGPVPLPLTGIQNEETFKRIEADTFKIIPGERGADAHASCFNCHWQAQKPTKDDCGGCHLSRSDYAARKLEVTRPPTLSPNAVKWFKDWPSGLPKRLSLKFRHDTHTPSLDGKTETNNHDVGCNTCHINVAQMTTLDIPKADVRIMSCAPCHTKEAPIPVGRGDGVTIFKEMELKREPANNYTCVACHTSVIGREPPPCTHYSVIGEPCPQPGQSANK